MMGMDWWVWALVVVLVLRVLTGTRRHARGWLWYGGGWDGSWEDGRLAARGRRARHLERRRAALEDAGDRLVEAGERLRGKARRERSTVPSSSASGSGRLSGSADASDPGRASGRRELPRKRVETPLDALQRRFAEGHITMEQYERELDKLYGLG